MTCTVHVFFSLDVSTLFLSKKGLLFPDPNDPLGNYNVTSRSPVVNKMVNLGGEERFP